MCPASAAAALPECMVNQAQGSQNGTKVNSQAKGDSQASTPPSQRTSFSLLWTLAPFSRAFSQCLNCLRQLHRPSVSPSSHELPTPSSAARRSSAPAATPKAPPPPSPSTSAGPGLGEADIRLPQNLMHQTKVRNSPIHSSASTGRQSSPAATGRSTSWERKSAAAAAMSRPPLPSPSTPAGPGLGDGHQYPSRWLYRPRNFTPPLTG